MKNNPQRGKHPDLFTAGYADTNVHVSLQNMTQDELEQCVPSDFSDSEWNEILHNEAIREIIIDNNKPFLEHVVKCVETAINEEIERLKSSKEIKRVFVSKVLDPYEDTYAMHMLDGEKCIKQHGESWLAERLMNTNNWDLFWNETDRKVTGKDRYGSPTTTRYDWDFSYEERSKINVVFSGDDIVKFDRLTDSEKNSILDDIEGGSVGREVNGEFCIDQSKHKIIVEFTMPGFYVGEVRWGTIDKSDVSSAPEIFIDEVVNYPEPKRTETLKLMAARGDTDAIVELNKLKSNAIKQGKKSSKELRYARLGLTENQVYTAIQVKEERRNIFTNIWPDKYAEASGDNSLEHQYNLKKLSQWVLSDSGVLIVDLVKRGGITRQDVEDAYETADILRLSRDSKPVLDAINKIQVITRSAIPQYIKSITYEQHHA